MIDRAEVAAAQLFRQGVGIDQVALVASARFPPPIAHEDPGDQGHQQVVQPLRLGAFFEGDLHGPPHPPEELTQGGGLRGQDGPGDHPPALRSHGGHGSCLRHIERDILGSPLHESRSWLLGSMGLGRLHGSNKGRALNMR